MRTWEGLLLQALTLLVTGFALAAAEPGVLLGVVGAALWALGMARHASSTHRVVVAGPAAVQRRRHHRDPGRAVPRLLDPDAAGRIRARAPSGLLPAV